MVSCKHKSLITESLLTKINYLWRIVRSGTLQVVVDPPQTGTAKHKPPHAARHGPSRNARAPPAHMFSPMSSAPGRVRRVLDLAQTLMAAPEPSSPATAMLQPARRPRSPTPGGSGWG